MIEVGRARSVKTSWPTPLKFGHKAVVEIVGMIEELQAKCPREKVGDIKKPDAGFVDAIRARVTTRSAK